MTKHIIAAAIFFGLVQGFTEPLPISSSGHLQLAQYFLGYELPGVTLEILTNFGSTLAIIALYFDDIMKLLKSMYLFVVDKTRTDEIKQDMKYIGLLIVAVIPAGVIGLLTKPIFDQFLTGSKESITLVGTALLVTAAALFFVRNKRGTTKGNQLTLKNAIVIGLFQAIAVMPGISRSGATLVGALSQDIDFDEALRFSFLLYIPVSFGSTLLELKDMLGSSYQVSEFALFALAAVVAGIVTYYTVGWFKNILKSGKLHYFALYCLVVGSMVIIFA